MKKIIITQTLFPLFEHHNQSTVILLLETTERPSVMLFRILTLALVSLSTECADALSNSNAPSPIRRALLASSPWVVALPPLAQAFDGKGASSYSGRTPLAAATKAKGYRDRIAADVKDFKTLGEAIDRGETEGKAWVGFFITYQRREPDAVGRTYAAQIDLVGADRSGGAGLLLVNTFAKPNKPPDNLPQYKKYTALTKTLGPIEAAGKAGDAAKAKKAWSKAAETLSEYLASVDMPAELSDPLYR
jgi:hypothetical protein